ncbi:hypothetical protein ABTY61_33770 [Kitasatospora sp. NPDC096128]|uniref:hypothetical protein n=1 Tax=Kitasatospora sp. NPDC096128 TaxID=3155547 RepID=UPI00332ECADA
MSLADFHLDTPDDRCGKARHGEDALAGYLARARRLFAEHSGHIGEGRLDLPDSFETLRHFAIAEVCLLSDESTTG